MITADDFLKWANVLGYVAGGGSGGDVTPIQIQEATFISGTDSGIADAYVVTLEPSASFTANNGSAFSFSPLNNNATTSPTVSVNGSAPLPIVLPNNTAVQANDIATGSVAPYLIYSNGVWLLMNALVSGGGGGGVTSTQVQQSAFNVGLDSGIADAYSVTLSPTVTSYTNGLWVLFNPVNANATGTPTLSVNGLDALQISNTFGGQLYPFDLNPGFIAVCFYCAIENSFILVNPISSGVQLGNIQNNNYTGVSDSGATNAYVMTLAPAPASIPNAGVNYTLQYAANANTGASTLTINGTVFDIVTPNYSPLIGGEILVNRSYDFLTSYNGVGFVAILLNSSLSLGVDAYAQSVALLAGNVFQTFGVVFGGPETSLDFSMLQNTSLQFQGTFNNATSVNLSNLENTSYGFTPNFNALLSLDMPVYTNNYVSGSFAPSTPNVTSVNLPDLAGLAGPFNPNFGSTLTSLSLPSLTTIAGVLSGTFSGITSLSLPLLTTSEDIVPNPMPLLTSIDLSSYSTCTGSIVFEADILTSFSLPALTVVNGAVTLTMPLLVTFSMNAGLLEIDGNFSITGASLDLASVDGILASLAALDGTGGTTAYSNLTIDLSGGTSAAPDAAGLASIAILTGRGNTVNHN